MFRLRYFQTRGKLHTSREEWQTKAGIDIVDLKTNFVNLNVIITCLAIET